MLSARTSAAGAGAERDRGGLSLGHLGPVPEGLVALGIGLVACILVTRWLGTKAEER